MSILLSENPNVELDALRAQEKRYEKALFWLGMPAVFCFFAFLNQGNEALTSGIADKFGSFGAEQNVLLTAGAYLLYGIIFAQIAVMIQDKIKETQGQMVGMPGKNARTHQERQQLLSADESDPDRVDQMHGI